MVVNSHQLTEYEGLKMTDEEKELEKLDWKPVDTAPELELIWCKNDDEFGPRQW